MDSRKSVKVKREKGKHVEWGLASGCKNSRVTSQVTVSTWFGFRTGLNTWGPASYIQLQTCTLDLRGKGRGGAGAANGNRHALYTPRTITRQICRRESISQSSSPVNVPACGKSTLQPLTNSLRASRGSESFIVPEGRSQNRRVALNLLTYGLWIYSFLFLQSMDATVYVRMLEIPVGGNFWYNYYRRKRVKVVHNLSEAHTSGYSR